MKILFSLLIFVSSLPVYAGEAAKATSPYSFSVKSIDGPTETLSHYAGQVLLIVNTASQCGYTPQLEGLQKLQETYGPKGFSVLGFPTNDFGGQDPGANKEIKSFAQEKYHVTFPLFAKTEVIGKNKSELFTWLTTQPLTGSQGDVAWNFEKFLISRDGYLLARFPSKVEPKDPELVKAIEAALAVKPVQKKP